MQHGGAYCTSSMAWPERPAPGPPGFLGEAALGWPRSRLMPARRSRAGTALRPRHSLSRGGRIQGSRVASFSLVMGLLLGTATRNDTRLSNVGSAGRLPLLRHVGAVRP